MPKKNVGIFSFTCDEGCSIYLIEIFNTKLVGWLEKMELKYFLSMKDKVEIKDFDISVIEGVISNEKEKKEVKEIRANSKYVIAMGSCAITGMPSGQRNNFNEDQMSEIKDRLKEFKYLPKCLSVKEAIKIDAEVQGCPINEAEFIKVFEEYLNK